MFKDIFDQAYEPDDSPPEGEDVNQFIIYFGNKEFAEFKRLAKVALRNEFPNDFQQRNASDLLLTVLRKHYDANINTQAEVNSSAGECIGTDVPHQ